MKKVLLTIMAIFLPLMAWADYSGSCGENVTWHYDESTYTLTISGSGEMIGWEQIDDKTFMTGWWEWKEEITTVIIKPGVTSIGWNAFRECRALTSVTIPNSVVTISEGAFSGCSSLTSLVIPQSVNSIGGSAFSYCINLTSITLPDNLTSSIGESAFEGCSSLTSIDIPYGVTSIGDFAFDDCISLTSVIIPNGVTSIGNLAFFRCEGLTSVIIPNSVTAIGESAFCGCSSLTSVTIPNSVITIGECAFSDCSFLTSVTIPNSVTAIGRHAFSWCYGLTSVTLGSGLTSIGYGAFLGCDAEICSLIQEPFAISYDTFEVYDSQQDTHRFPSTLYVPSGTSGRYQSTDFWSRFERIVEMAVIAPVEGETTVNAESLGSKNLANSVVDGVYYNVGLDGYDASDGSIVINQPSNMEKIGNGIPGTPYVLYYYTGIIFKVAAGKGTITVKAKTSGNAQLAVKVGNGAPTTASKSEKGDVVVNYDVTEESYVYIYSTVSGSGTRASSNDVVKIYGLTVSPDATGIAEVKRDPIVRDRYYTLDGRQVVGKPTAKGIYILNGRKVVVK